MSEMLYLSDGLLRYLKSAICMSINKTKVIHL